MENMKTPKPQHPDEDFGGNRTHQQAAAPGDLLSGLNSLLSSQPRPFDQMDQDLIDGKLQSEKESHSKAMDMSIDQDEEEGEDEDSENDEELEHMADDQHYGTI